MEDPQNTWNKQLMDATLIFDVAEAQSLIQKGADPVNAREETPFSKGDLLSPLAALLLQGISSSEAIDTAQLLIDHGAGLDDLMKLPGAAHFGPPVKPEEVPRVASSSGRKPSEPESQDSPSSGAKAAQTTEEGDASGEQVTEVGTVLHYVTALGDHAHLLKILLVAGVPRPSLPQSLMHEVELGVMVPPKPIPTEERLPSRKSRSNSLPRRPSRLGRAAPPEGHAPRSSLPVLTAVPSPLDGFRLQKQKVPSSPPAGVEKQESDVAPAPNTQSECLTAEAAEADSQALFDFSVQSSSGLTAVEWAIEHGDLTAARLLMFYGAQVDFQRVINGSQSAIARACSNGDVGLVERLLDAGDTMTQLSRDGRYTLVHYAAAHPPVLEYLSRRGLSLDYENAFGESALISLIRYGTGRNADHAVREAPRMGDAARLGALPYCAQRNYILTPLPPLVGGFGSKSKSLGKTGKTPGKDQTTSAEEQKNSIGGKEMGTWWSFSLLPAADMIQHLVDCGASVNGTIPTEEVGLRYVQFAKEAAQRRASTTTPLPASKKSHLSNSLSGRDDMEAGAASSLPYTDHLAPGRAPLRLTPLMTAIRTYHPELIRKLVVEYHADLAERDCLGATCLHHAAVCPHPSVLELLTSPSVLYNFPTLDLNATDMNGRTPLHYAVVMGRMDTVKLLLSHPSILAGKPDSTGLTPLHLAVLSNEKECIQLLLGHSDMVLETTSSVAASSAAKGGRRQKTAKSTASSATSVRQPSAGAEFMMVEVEAEDYIYHCTALEMAIKHHRDPAIVQLLLMEGHATMQRWSGLEDGGSLLHRAVVDNREDYVRILLDNFADPNEPDNEEFTPLYLAVACDAPNIALIRNLVSAGACSYAQSGTNLCTPLHIAAKQGNAEVLHLLVHERSSSYNRDYDDTNKGRSPALKLIPSGFFTMTDSQCRTPLHILCAHSNPETQSQVLPLIEELMLCDSSAYLCTMMDAKGRIALHEACRAHFEEAAKLLLSVDPLGVYYVDGHGNTPLHDTVFTEIPNHPPLLSGGEDPEQLKLFASVEEIAATLVAVVAQTLPQPLKGLPYVNSSLTQVFSPHLSITSQLKLLRRYQNRCVAPQKKDSTDCDGTPGEDAVIRTVQQYIQLGDKSGRCAVLLAGEAGNVVAAKTLIRLSEYQSGLPDQPVTQQTS